MTVYFIRRKGDQTGPIKIGFAKSLDRRLKEFATATPEGFDVIAAIDCGRGVERQLHKDLADYCVGGEWFAPSIDVMVAIEKVKNGSYASFDNHHGPRPIIAEPVAELVASIVDETRFYLNELVKREFCGAGDTISAARDRVMITLGLSVSYGATLWNKSQGLSDVQGEVYRVLRLNYALAVEREGTINEMQRRHLAFVRAESARRATDQKPVSAGLGKTAARD